MNNFFDMRKCISLFFISLTLFIGMGICFAYAEDVETKKAVSTQPVPLSEEELQLFASFIQTDLEKIQSGEGEWVAAQWVGIGLMLLVGILIALTAVIIISLY